MNCEQMHERLPDYLVDDLDESVPRKNQGLRYGHGSTPCSKRTRKDWVKPERML